MCRPWITLASTLALLGPGTACSKPHKMAPLVSTSGGYSTGSTKSTSRAPDASTVALGGDDGGGGAVGKSGALSNECKNVPSVKFIGEDTPPGQFLNAITAPADFNATRVVASWEESCVQPTIRVELSDGACPNGKGHSLRFLFDVGAIAGGTIRLGQNTIVPNPGSDGIPIRYVRPVTLDPRGTWGTCAGASGTLDFVGVLGTTVGTTLEGRFELELSSCDDSMQPLQIVSGTFSALLRRGLDDVCPSK